MKRAGIASMVFASLLATKGIGSHAVDTTEQSLRKALVAEMSDYIKNYAYFHAGSAIFRYDSRIDTLNRVRLYVGQQVSPPGGRGDTQWYYIDFMEPLKPDELVVRMGRNGNFFVQSTNAVTKKVGKRKDKKKVLFVYFVTNPRKRTTDFEQLYERMGFIIGQLTKP